MFGGAREGSGRSFTGWTGIEKGAGTQVVRCPNPIAKILGSLKSKGADVPDVVEKLTALERQLEKVEAVEALDSEPVTNNQTGLVSFSYFSTRVPLRRLGRKIKLVPFLAEHMPNDKNQLISFFFGTGAFELAIFETLSYLIANDLDDNVYNLYEVLSDKDSYEKLIERFEMLPIGDATWEIAKNFNGSNKVDKALNFLYLSNFSYLGKMGAIKGTFNNDKKITLKTLKNFYKEIVLSENVTATFFNRNYLDVLNSLSFHKDRDQKSKTFIFADPPYLNTGNNYSTPVWTEADHFELQKHLKESGLDFMLCEFDNPFVIECATENGFNIIYYKERRNLSSKKTASEVLITNYEKSTVQQLDCWS